MDQRNFGMRKGSELPYLVDDNGKKKQKTDKTLLINVMSLLRRIV